MRAWESVAVPKLDGFGVGPTPVVHDTATGRDVTLRADGTARMYVCGITPYDATHIGHASTYLAFDLLNRAWRDAGYEVRYVQNVTDVDDPLLERARFTHEEWHELAERETQRFRDDMVALRVIPPDEYAGAVESIPLVIELIQQLQELGYVYEVDNDLYFAVHSDPRFGSISHLHDDEMTRLFGERGGDPDRTGKKNPLDCLLWQGERQGEPSWDSPFGRGRPGWHVECAAIALVHLGESFDVQGGGSDLVFPHHEMSASEAQAAFSDLTFAKTYVHAGLVAFEGEKMSKSRGNLVFVSRLRESGISPMVIRLAVLSHHYRSDWEWKPEDIERAKSRLQTWRDATGQATMAQAEQLVSVVRSALSLDLDAPAAIEAIDQWAEGHHGALSGGDGSGAATIRALVDARLGILL